MKQKPLTVSIRNNYFKQWPVSIKIFRKILSFLVLGDLKTWTSAENGNGATFETYGGVFGGSSYPSSNLHGKSHYWISAGKSGARGIKVTFDRKVKVSRFSVQSSNFLLDLFVASKIDIYNMTMKPLLFYRVNGPRIGAFRPIRRDFTRLRDHRVLSIASKGRAAVFLSYIEPGTSVKSLSQFKKTFVP